MKNNFLIISTLITAVACKPSNTKLDSFHGYWKMDSFWQSDSTKKWIQADWMKGGNGYILYDGLGHMSIHITPKKYSASSLNDTTQKEKFLNKPEIYTLANYVYTGTYDVLGKDSISHNRLSHGNPNYNLSASKKRFEIIDDSLYLYSNVAGTKCKIKWIRIK